MRRRPQPGTTSSRSPGRRLRLAAGEEDFPSRGPSGTVKTGFTPVKQQRAQCGSNPHDRTTIRRWGKRAGWSVSRVLYPGITRATAIPLGRGSPRASRDPPGRRRSGSRPGRTRRPCHPYVVLLPVGFAVPPPSPGARCALTAPFHPCPQARRPRRAVCSLWHFPWGCPRRALPGTVLPWSPDFPPPPRGRRRPSDHPARFPHGRTARTRQAVLPLGCTAAGGHWISAATVRGIWLGRQDSNLRMPDPKSGALPLGDAPPRMPNIPAVTDVSTAGPGSRRRACRAEATHAGTPPADTAALR